MTLVGLLYFLFTFAAALFVATAVRHEQLRWHSLGGAMLILLATYLMSNTVGQPSFFPMDFICLLIFSAQWWLTKTEWSLALAVLFGFECLRHVAYRMGDATDYILFLNICYVAQLACVSVSAILKLLREPRNGRTAS